MPALRQTGRRRQSATIGLVLAVAAILNGCGTRPPAETAIPAAPATDAPATDTRTAARAAPGHVDDQLCRRCHADLFDSFQATGMARSFFPPGESTAIEDFGGGFSHAPSRQRFEMTLREGKYLFRRFQTAADGQPINVFEQPVDWILGSGNKSRTYLYQTPAGELFQLPVAWYSDEQRWGMAPGYDRPDHEGVTRRVRRECLFCHNAYPDVPAGSDAHGVSQSFPRNLPHGIGCQRCHGPGADHVRLNLAGTSEPRAGIVNPASLPAPLRDDVCHQCHLQPSVALFGIRRFGRNDYSFQPGQSLADYLAPLEVVDANRPAADRFEINHHPYRLHQSRCFLQSDGKLNCLTCHDPHRTVAVDRRAGHYRAACQTCHPDTSCGRAERPAPDTSDCVACHMPRRRTQDVVHVIATDHRIGRHEDADLRLAPLAETEPQLNDVVLSGADRGTERGELYRAVAVLRATGGRHPAAAEHLARLLSRSHEEAIEPHLDLASARVTQGQPSAAAELLEPVIQRHPSSGQAHEILGLAQLQMGTIGPAEQSFLRSLEQDPSRPVAALNLGRLELTRDRPDQAVTRLERVVASHPTLAPAWYFLGEAHARQSHWQDAVRCYQRALEIDPNLKEGYFGIERGLKELGRTGEAERYGRQVPQAP